ncbi:MAG: amino acid racemase [Chloroflexi bacterium]|nr:amino acid racemase [Chloroflexota bacterium]
MKKIGIVGGLGPEATLYYYRTMVDKCRKSEDFKYLTPPIIIYSIDDVRWKGCKDRPERVVYMREIVESLAKAGADFAIIACNTVHYSFDKIKADSPIPMISIVEATCDVVLSRGLKKVGLLGSATTMQANFYQVALNKRGISVAVPDSKEQDYINDKIYSELINGLILDNTHEKFLNIARRLIKDESIQGLILGCTEIPLLIVDNDSETLGIPVFNTSRIHVESALKYCLEV